MNVHVNYCDCTEMLFCLIVDLSPGSSREQKYFCTKEFEGTKILLYKRIQTIKLYYNAYHVNYVLNIYL